MMSPLQQLIDTIAKEKNIEPTVIISAIEDAVLAASRKAYKSNENLKARFNPESGQVDLFAIKQIVDTVNDPSLEVSLSEAQQLYGEEAEVDMEIEFPKPTDVLGRIAAQTAKQVIFQKYAKRSGRTSSPSTTSASAKSSTRRPSASRMAT